MKKGLFLAILLLSTVLSVTAQQTKLFDIVGKVEVKGTNNVWVLAKEGMTIPVKAMISTGFNSSASFQIDGTTLKLRSMTRIVLSEYIDKETTVSTGIRLNTGKVRADVKPLDNKKIAFTVTSPVATASVRGTEFDFNGVSLEVLEGVVVLVNDKREEVSVPAGGKSEAKSKAPPSNTIENKERDSGVSVRTTPPIATITLSQDPVPGSETPVTIPSSDTIFGDSGSIQIIID